MCFAGIDYGVKIAVWGECPFLNRMLELCDLLSLFFFSLLFFASSVSAGTSKGPKPSEVEFSYSFWTASLRSWFDERNALIYFLSRTKTSLTNTLSFRAGKSQNPL